jgi:AraC-like DNA-binding protein
VINQGFNQNFFDYINTYRCEQVKRLLKGPDKGFTVTEAMYQSGFNSKSSFNKEFKKLTGQTPKEFRRSLQHG